MVARDSDEIIIFLSLQVYVYLKPNMDLKNQ